MHALLQNQLETAYPLLFSDSDSEDSDNILLPIEDGWAPILHRFCASLSRAEFPPHAGRPFLHTIRFLPNNNRPALEVELHYHYGPNLSIAGPVLFPTPIAASLQHALTRETPLLCAGCGEPDGARATERRVRTGAGAMWVAGKALCASCMDVCRLESPGRRIRVRWMRLDEHGSRVPPLP
ncbi:hypothetical protein HMN09_00996400 [Mycena chlorophos]|uniref:Uncharacterized protein n=1 Tax=Mycena chlorophos TaxID=658473 RepID=A0A8H6SJN8_MYCCL|nr:hypothetical protein HMN09_00996400 [Mycena chlorophos]